MAGKGLGDMEQKCLQDQAESIETWWADTRWNGIKRNYTAAEVAVLRGTITPEYDSNDAAKKAYTLFRELQAAKKATATFGALDPVQVVQMAKYLPVGVETVPITPPPLDLRTCYFVCLFYTCPTDRVREWVAVVVDSFDVE